MKDTPYEIFFRDCALLSKHGPVTKGKRRDETRFSEKGKRMRSQRRGTCSISFVPLSKS